MMWDFFKAADSLSLKLCVRNQWIIPPHEVFPFVPRTSPWPHGFPDLSQFAYSLSATSLECITSLKLVYSKFVKILWLDKLKIKIGKQREKLLIMEMEMLLWKHQIKHGKLVSKTDLSPKHFRKNCLGSCSWGLALWALPRRSPLELNGCPCSASPHAIAHLIMHLHANESSKQLARKVCFPLLQLINLENLIVAHFGVCANANEALFELFLWLT